MNNQDFHDILDEINRRFQDYDKKLLEHMAQATESRVNLQHLCNQVQTLNKLITQGNGHDSVLMKLTKLSTEMADVKEDSKENKENIQSLVNSLLHTDETEVKFAEVSKERWIAIGKIAGLLALAAPGIVAFFTMM